MKRPTCDCIRKALNQFANVDGISTTTEVFYICKNGDKGYEEKSVFLLSNACPQCSAPYEEDGK